MNLKYPGGADTQGLRALMATGPLYVTINNATRPIALKSWDHVTATSWDAVTGDCTYPLIWNNWKVDNIYEVTAFLIMYQAIKESDPWAQ